MPKYTAKITCPTTASHSSRTTAKLKVSQGIISHVSVTWSFGSNLLNALVVMYEGAQIIPSTGGGECRGNGAPDSFPEYIELKRQHPELNIEVWNEGNSYEQDVYISIEVLPDVPKWASGLTGLLSRLLRMVGL